MRAAAALAAAVLLLGACGGGGSTATAKVGRPAPALAGPAIVEGQRVDLATFRGRPVLVNFWGSWCDPCRRELPRLAKAAAAGTAIVGVDVKDSARLAREEQQATGAGWPSLSDPKEEVAMRWGLRGAYPVTYALDAAGVVRALHIGEMSDDDIAGLVRAASGA